MNIKPWLYKTGANPQKSLLLLMVGFFVFLPGAYLLVSDYYYQYWLRVLGYILLIIGFYFGLKGWLGVLANRIAKFINVPGGRFADKSSAEDQD